MISTVGSAVTTHTPRTLVGNTFQQGFYWPTAVADAEQIICTCEGCQYYARQTHLLAQALQMIPIRRAFTVWGFDLVGPLKKVPGGYTHLLVTIDKFTKWIEARPISVIKSEKPCCSSSTSSIALEYRTPSSWTTAHSSPARNSYDSTMNTSGAILRGTKQDW